MYLHLHFSWSHIKFKFYFFVVLSILILLKNKTKNKNNILKVSSQYSAKIPLNKVFVLILVGGVKEMIIMINQ